jgi:hypothetical protein
MAKMTEAKEPELIDEEDELDGWGPVRVRRSSIPAQPSFAPISTKSASEREATEGSRASDAENCVKRIVT